VTYTFNEGSFTGKQTVVKQKGRANPDCSTGAKWQARARVPAILRDAILSAYSVCARTRILHPRCFCPPTPPASVRASDQDWRDESGVGR